MGRGNHFTFETYTIYGRNGKLVLEGYFNGYAFDFSGPRFRGDPVPLGRDRLHLTASVNKSITTSLVEIAIDQGFIRDVDERMTTFFPQYPDLINEKKSRIILEHLLNMTSSHKWNEIEHWFRDPQLDEVEFYVLSQ